MLVCHILRQVGVQVEFPGGVVGFEAGGGRVPAAG